VDQSLLRHTGQHVTRVGVDVQDVADVRSARERHGARYDVRLFTEEELSRASAHPLTADRYFAGRFAGREAVLKLLALADAPAPWAEIAIRGDRPLGVELTGSAQAAAHRWGITVIRLSIHYGRSRATAVAVADAHDL